MPPALKRWGPPKGQGLCSHLAHLWATSDSAPRSEAVGTPQTAGVMYECAQTPTCGWLTTCDRLKVLPWVDVGAGGLGAGKTSGAGTRGVSLDVVIGVGNRDTDTNGGESSDNRSKIHADCGPAENPSL